MVPSQRLTIKQALLKISFMHIAKVRRFIPVCLIQVRSIQIVHIALNPDFILVWISPNDIASGIGATVTERIVFTYCDIDEVVRLQICAYLQRWRCL